MKPNLPALTVALLALWSLSACGGGGGGSAPPPSARLVPAAVPRAVARGLMQTSLTTVQTAALVSQFGTTGSTSTTATTTAARRGVLHALQAVRAHRRVESTTACTNSFTQTFVQTGLNTGVLTDTYYYDTACTQPLGLIVAIVDSTAGTATGTITLYDTSGNVYQYDTLQLAYSNTNGTALTLAISLAKSVAAPPYSSIGIACNVNAATTVLTCGAAGAYTLADTSMAGTSLSITGTDAVTAAGSSVTVNESANAYVGSSGALTVAAGTGVAWNVVGGTQVDSTTSTGTVSAATTGKVTSASLSVTDALYNASVNLNATAAGITATEKQGTTTVATANVDLNGNGSITYADGTQGTVTGFTIVS